MDQETQKEVIEIIKEKMQFTKYTKYDAKNAAYKFIADKYNPTIQKCRYSCEIEHSKNRSQANYFNVFKTTEEVNKEALQTAKGCFSQCDLIQNEANEYYYFIQDYIEEHYKD